MSTRQAKPPTGPESASRKTKPSTGRFAQKPSAADFLLKKHVWIIVLTGFGAALRIYGLGRRGLWVDEVVTWNLAKKGLFDPFGAHGIYFFLVRTAMSYFGDSESALRAVSAVFGIASIPMIYLCGAALWGEREGLVAAAAVTTSNWLILFSQEARFYTGLFFMTSVMLYALISIWKTGHFRYVPLFLASIPLLRGMHPTAMVFCGIATGWLGLWLAAFPAGRAVAWNWLTWGSRAWDTRAKITTGAAGALFLAGIYVLIRSSGVYRDIFSSLSLSNRTENVSFTPKFFYEHYRVFSLVDARFPWVGVIPALVQLAASIAGWYRAARDRPLFTMMTASLLLGTFLLLFTYQTFQPYELKYSMFFHPPILMVLAGGAVLFIDRGREYLRAKGVEVNVAWGLAGVCAIVMIAGMGQYAKNSGGEFGGFKESVLRVKREYESGDQIVSHDFGRAPVQYHVIQSGLPLPNYTMLEEERGDGEVEIARLEALAQGNHNVWFIGSLNWRIKPKLHDYLLSHFEEVAKYPSLWGERFEVELMKWKWPGRTVTGAGADTLRFGAPLAFSAAKPARLDLFVSRGGGYTIKARTSAPIEFFRASIWDKKEHIDEHGDHALEGKTAFGVGPQPLIAIPAPGTAGEVTLRDLTIEPEPGAILAIEAERPSTFALPGRFEMREVGGAEAMVYEVNCGATYDIVIPRSGLLKLQLRALEKRPGGVVFDVTLDGKPQGLLQFNNANDQWGEQMFILRGTPGPRVLGISFVSDASRGKEPEMKIDGLIDKIQLSATTTQEAAEVDRLNVAIEQFVNDPGPDPAVGFPPVGTVLDGTQGWEVDAGTNAKIELPKFAPEVPALRIDLNPKGAAGLISSPFAVQPGKAVYYELEIATEAVINHTANAAIIFWNADGSPAHRNALYTSMSGLHNAVHWTEGINHQSEHHFERFAAVQAVPPTAVAASIYLVCYDNSVQQVVHDGLVWYRNLRVHRPQDLDQAKR